MSLQCLNLSYYHPAGPSKPLSDKSCKTNEMDTIIFYCSGDEDVSYFTSLDHNISIINQAMPI